MTAFANPVNSASISAAHLLTVVACANETRGWALSKAFHASPHADGLMGICAHASIDLLEKLVDKGFEPVIHVVEDRVHGTHHCYVALGPLVIDVTATQFKEDMAPIVVLNRETIDVHQSPWWGLGTTVDDRCDLVDFLIERGWPKNQIPSKYKNVDASSDDRAFALSRFHSVNAPQKSQCH